MSEWKIKRFWKEAGVAETEGGFAVHLDGRPVNTPCKTALILPSRALAEAVAAEWAAQEGPVNPETMPFTRSANSAIDKVTPQQAAVTAMLAEYGDSDLLCYRADAPQGLVERQAAGWDPLLEWTKATYGARLEPVAGVMHRPQAPEALAVLHREVAALDPFTLTGFHDLVTLSGSLVIGLAALRDQQPVEALWTLSRLDEDWQEEQWGADEEAQAAAAQKRAAFLHAKTFADLAAKD